MKILVKWWSGRRERSDFRMLLANGATEKRASAMLGEEQWISCNPGNTNIDKVKRLAIDALACEYVKMVNEQLRCERTDAKIMLGPETIPGGNTIGTIVMIDLGEVVFA